MTIENIEQNQKEVKRTERGWAGHFICSSSCWFRRNTLLECGEIKIVVSTIGNYHNEQGQQDEVGVNRDYETMAFHVDPKTGDYKDIDPGKEIFFESPWAFKVQKSDKYVDLKANNMHEAVVQEITEKLQRGETFQRQEEEA
jgi:hypothetical protein